MGSLIADLRYAARELRRRPGFSPTAILSLALGMGATSAVFSVIYGVLINPFPYAGSDRMMQLALRDGAGRFRYVGMNGDQIEQLRQARTIESIVAEDGWNLTTTDGDIPEDVVAAYISPNAPNHWGVPAMMGRWLVSADAPPGQDPARVVVLGYRFRFPNLRDEPPYSPAAAGVGQWLEVIGVVADARNDGLRNPIRPAVYVPYTLKLRMFTQILVRAKVPPLSILRDVRAELVRVDREQQVMRVRDLQAWITESPEYAQQRLVARLFGIFSVLALALSAVGLYSVVSYGVATRTTSSASGWRSARARATLSA